MKQIELQNLLASNIRRFRNAKKITQAELAEKINISEDSIKRIELARQWPSSKTLSLISDVLDVDVYRLFFPYSDDFKMQNEKSALLKNAIAKELHNYIEKVFEDIIQ